MINCNSICHTASSQNQVLLQVLDTHTWPLRGGHLRVPKTNQAAQHNRQWWLNPQLPKHCSQRGSSLTLLAASVKPVADFQAVRAEFSEAGVPGEVIMKVLKQCPSYLRQPIDTKLRPALQLWLKQLGSQQLSECLDKYPRLLRRTPEECNDVYMWLAGLGVDAERVQQKRPGVMSRQLNEVQSTVQAIQQGLQLTDEQLPAFFRRHVISLLYSPERVAQTLQTVADLLAVPAASKEMQDIVMVCKRELFARDPAVLHHLVLFFCEEFKGGQHAAKAALKEAIYCVSERSMRERAAELKAMFGWTEDELNRSLCSNPTILTKNPSTVANNIQKLQAHNFTSTQALNIYASRPSLAGYDWSSPSNVEKLTYLFLVLQVSTSELVSMHALLGGSLEHVIGPRSEFMYRIRAIPPDTPLRQSKLSSYVTSNTDAYFAAKFNRPSASPPMMFDEDFKHHWRQRWTFLTHQMGLSIADISASRALLYVSLPNTLAPRWHFLTLLEGAQADFKAVDHLTALATLSDERFAQAFFSSSAGVVYNKDFIQSAQVAV